AWARPAVIESWGAQTREHRYGNTASLADDYAGSGNRPCIRYDLDREGRRLVSRADGGLHRLLCAARRAHGAEAPGKIPPKPRLSAVSGGEPVQCVVLENAHRRRQERDTGRRAGGCERQYLRRRRAYDERLPRARGLRSRG